jgi:NitT/TauT family transport system substrate-binding protein
MVLKRAGVDLADVKIEKVEATTMAPLLVQGRVDGAVLWWPDDAFVSPMAAAVGKKTKVLPFTDTGFNMYGLTVVSTTKLLDERSDLAKRFIEALLASFKIMREDPGGAVAALIKVEPQIVAASAVREAELSNALFFNEISDRDGFGAITSKLLAETYDWLDQAGQVKTRRDPELFVDRRFLPR